jgi:hypothetical protein
MPKPQINLQPFKGLITTWFNDDISSDDIAKRLADEHNVVCTARTIERRLKEWGVAKRVRIQETVGLRLKIASMYYINFSDDIIVRALNKEGYQIRKTSVVRIRKTQGCKRWMTAWEREEANSELWNIVKEELDKGTVE